MKIAVMQPYLFPYIGYWQLIGAVDKFVILDDVNFIKRGYINRNSILINGKPYMFTVPVKSASQNRLIKDTKLNFDDKEKKRFIAQIENAYKKASMYKEVMPLIENIIGNETDDITDFIKYSLEIVKDYLNMPTELEKSSEIEKDNSLTAERRIIEICKCLGADIYINPCGGRALYNAEDFNKEGMQLYFLDTRFDNIIYKQFSNEFVKSLSIIDVLMFNTTDKIQEFLKEYDLNI